MRMPKPGVFLREVYLNGGKRGRRLFRGVLHTSIEMRLDEYCNAFLTFSVGRAFLSESISPLSLHSRTLFSGLSFWLSKSH